jgi:hypothetical protein
MTTIYSVCESATNVTLEQLAVGDSALPEGYTGMITLQGKDAGILYAFNNTTKLLDAYRLTEDEPYIQAITTGSGALDLYPWDTLKSFVLGNKSYLMTYEKKKGFFGFYEVNDDYTLSAPYTFMNQRSFPTQGFSEVQPFVVTGLMYVLGYDDEKGTVAIFSLDVTATSIIAGTPPLNMENVWYHQWARGWEDFSFFQLGQSNFFFKINKGKLNVNIDHVLDTPALGTVEIGSWLQDKMPNAIDVSLAAIIPWSNGEPYLATYDNKTNDVNVYRIHPDCQGWTNLNTTNAPVSAQMTTYRLNDTSYILLYS